MAWIDRGALAHNARRALALAEGRAVIGVVKADGYGHGAETVARGLLAQGVPRLAVVSIAEGAALRRAGIGAPILLLGGARSAAAMERAVKLSLTPVLQDEADFELARTFGRPDAPLAVEVELDTGMARMGAAPAAAEALLARVLDAPQLALAGVFTHLARADAADPAPGRAQCEAFARPLGAVLEASDTSPGLHVVNSAGLLRRAELESGLVETTAVRPGLLLYGISPFADRAAAALDLEPVMTLAARVVAVRRIGPGDSVGYGSEWRAERETTIATLPIGYADGIPRAAWPAGRIHLAGRLRPIAGRVSMDSVCVELGDDPVAVGDVATVFGRTPQGERIPIEDFAAACGTIGYEIAVGVGARVLRWVGAGRPTADPEASGAALV